MRIHSESCQVRTPRAKRTLRLIPTASVNVCNGLDSHTIRKPDSNRTASHFPEQLFLQRLVLLLPSRHSISEVRLIRTTERRRTL